MCMLSYLPAGVQASEGELWNGGTVNPDGHGWAIVNAYRQQITVRKSMDLDEALTTFCKERESNDSGPAIFHSRIATSGLVDITGVHPFYVGEDRSTVVAHNGVLFSPPKDSLKSDTRIFAERILPRYRRLDKPANLAQVEKIAGWYNKLAILTVNPGRQKNAYLINEEAGHWSTTSGIWHSTWDYLPYTYTVSKGGKLWTSSTGWEDGDVHPFDVAPDEGVSPWPCTLCGAYNTVDKYTLVCSMCRSCTECDQYVEECQCYTPERFRGSSKELVVYNGQLRELQDIDR